MGAARSRRAVLVVLGAASLVAGLPSVALAGGTDRWSQVSANPAANAYPRTVNYDLPTAARFGTSLQVVWPAQRGDGTASYYSAQLDSSGATTSRARQLTAVSGWAGLSESPRLLGYSGRRMLVFSGQRDLDGENPFSVGAAYYALGTSATSWSLGAGALSSTTDAASATGSDAVIDDQTPVWAGTLSGGTGLTWHSGVSIDVPAPRGTDREFTLRGCCAYDAALARDTVSGAVYGAFYSSSGQAIEQGVWAGQILPTKGSFSRAPGSFVLRGGTASSLPPDQRVAMAARVGGGIYLAYRTGYPSPAQWVTLWRAGQPTGLSVPGSAGARSVSLSAGPDGRLWVAWTNDRGTRVRVVATNQTATAFGPVRSIAAPPGYRQLWHTVLVARRSTVDLVVSAQNANGAINIFHRQVR